MQLLDDDDLAYNDSESDSPEKQTDGRPAWMKTLSTSLFNWMRLIPKVKQAPSNNVFLNNTLRDNYGKNYKNSHYKVHTEYVISSDTVSTYL